MMAELFPTNVRYSGTAISYNIGFGIIGGLTPLIATSLIHWSNNYLAPSWCLMLTAVLSLITLLFMRETYREPLS
jgi:MHS family proline/betaine transporter-like MFS transporter